MHRLVDSRTVGNIYDCMFSVCANNVMSLSMKSLIYRSNFYRSIFLSNPLEAEIIAAFFSRVALPIECSDINGCIATNQEPIRTSGQGQVGTVTEGKIL